MQVHDTYIDHLANKIKTINQSYHGMYVHVNEDVYK